MTDIKRIKLPPEFVLRIENQPGINSLDFFDSLESVSPISIRINPRKWKKPLLLDKIPWCQTGFYLPVRPSFTLDPCFHGGAYYVQEAGSMLIEQAFTSIKKAEKQLILDLCAAPGGKSTHLLTLLKPGDLLVSNEVIRSRAVILQENIQKWGSSNVVVTNNDPKDFVHLKNIFDVVVVDAPCSGEGLFRKDHAAIGEWSINNTQLCAARQKRIISEAWECLKPGGYLIYSTCTFNPGENEENLQWLTEQNEASPIEIKTEEPWNIETIRYKNIIGYQTFPHKTRAEGFFIGILRKNGNPEKNKKLPKSNSKKWVSPSLKTNSNFVNWINDSQNEDFLQKGDDSFFLKSEWHPLISVFEKYLNILQAGTPVATLKGTQFSPHPALALSCDFNTEAFHHEDLTLEQSLRYLQRENIHIEGNKTGWILVKYNNLPLGWMKNIGNRTNNYFPKERRIRMNINEAPTPWHEKLI
jgi:16S rRNA C967 or C1407 C5-methylase (RsmB/RsmF family)/NOL1/NOP2/fmu family ribosome biogenesis protein